METSKRKQWVEEFFGLYREHGEILADRMFIVRNALNRPLWCANRIMRSCHGGQPSAGSVFRAAVFMLLRAQWEAAYFFDRYFGSFFEVFPKAFFDMPNTRIVALLESAFVSPLETNAAADAMLPEMPCDVKIDSKI